MNFGKRFKEQTIVSNFFELCKEDGVGVSEMKRRAGELKTDERYGPSVVRKIENRIEKIDECPNCEKELFVDTESEELYCPKCDTEQ